MQRKDERYHKPTEGLETSILLFLGTATTSYQQRSCFIGTVFCTSPQSTVHIAQDGGPVLLRRHVLPSELPRLLPFFSSAEDKQQKL